MAPDEVAAIDLYGSPEDLYACGLQLTKPPTCCASSAVDGELPALPNA